MTWIPATERPTEPGWYLVLQRHTTRPLVLWWSMLSTQWRHGCVLVDATHWSGPIPLPATPEDGL